MATKIIRKYLLVNRIHYPFEGYAMDTSGFYSEECLESCRTKEKKAWILAISLMVTQPSLWPILLMIKCL